MQFLSWHRRLPPCRSWRKHDEQLLQGRHSFFSWAPVLLSMILIRDGATCCNCSAAVLLPTTTPLTTPLEPETTSLSSAGLFSGLVLSLYSVPYVFGFGGKVAGRPLCAQK